jgi:arylsulfatase
VPSALPNVLLIVVDALRPDRLGCYGYARNTSPKLDALAAEGVVFTDVMAQGSSTITSVPLLLTGRRFGDAGMQQMRSDHLRGHARPGIEVPTLAELLREHGYETALVAASAVVGCAGGLDRGFDYFDFSCARIAEWNVSSASDVNLRACEWLESVHSGRCPFFLYLHYMEPHNHYRPPCEFCVFGRPGYTVRDTKRNVAMMDVVLDVLETGEGVTEELLSSNGMSLRDIERLSDLYDDEVLCMDHHLGQLFQRLRDVGIYENTLIIVTADHGEAFLEHGTLGHGQVLYQEVVHVPLIVRGPGIPHGAAVHDLVELVDVAPTILEAVGASLDGTMSGRSFYQALLGTGGVTDNTGIAELPAVMRAFRCGPLKLIVSPKGVEMYDLSEDPRETTNLASSRPEQADRLRGMLRELVQQRPAPLEVAEPVTPRKLEALKALGYIR